MKQNNTFKIALLMALVAGEAFAATTQSRPPRKPIASVRKSGQPSANRQKINPGVQSQKTDTTKQDVVNVVKQFMRNQATPQNLNRLDTFLAKLSQDDLKTLNIKGIKNEKDANNMVWKVKKLADKAPKKPGDNKVEDLLKQIAQLTNDNKQLTNDKKTLTQETGDLNKKLEELKKADTSGSIDEKDKKIKELEGTIESQSNDISVLGEERKKLEAAKGTWTGERDKLMTTLGDLKEAAEGASDFDKLSTFATELEQFLDATIPPAAQNQNNQPLGGSLQGVLDYLKAVKTDDEARTVTNLTPLLGGGILEVYEVSSDGNDLTKNGVKQKISDGASDPADMLKGKKFILVDGDKIGADSNWQDSNA